MNEPQTTAVITEENKFLLLWVAIAFITVVGLVLVWYVNYSYSKELRELTATLGPVPKSPEPAPLSSADVSNLENELNSVNIQGLDNELNDIDKELQ